MLLEVIAICCAALIGCAAHRASLCNVRAVAEVMASRSAHMLWSLLQAALWMATLTGVLVIAFAIEPKPIWTRAMVPLGLVGGLVFGVAGWTSDAAALRSPWLQWPRFAPWLLAVCLAWAMHCSLVLWRLRPDRIPLGSLVLAPSYHLSVSAAFMGLAAGLLYATQGVWSYSNFLRAAVLNAFDAAPAPSAWHGVLLLGLLGGMIASALQRRSLRWRHDGSGSRHGARRQRHDAAWRSSDPGGGRLVDLPVNAGRYRAGIDRPARGSHADTGYGLLACGL